MSEESEVRARAKVLWAGGLKTVSMIRGMELHSDKPKSYHGTNTAPAPLEIFVSSLGSCFLTTFLHAAMRSRVEVEDCTADVKAMTRMEKGIESIISMELKLMVWGPKEDEVKLEKAFELSKSICSITNALSVPLDFTLKLKE